MDETETYLTMNIIKNTEFGGERPLYCEHDLRVEGVTINVGESSLKECSNIEAEGCTFNGKYPLWCCNGVKVHGCTFLEGARSGIWHTDNIEMSDTMMGSPKMFRETTGIRIRNVDFPLAEQTFWACRDIDVDGMTADHGDYIFLHCIGATVRNFRLNGNYAFQKAQDIEIHDSDLQSKDALWESENVTVYDSFINGEYLGWHSKNLRLVRCRIGGTQPLCYAENLILEDCTFEADADLAFEYSSVEATVLNHVPSIKNPRTGHIRVGSVGEIIIDKNIKAPGDCKIETL